MLDRKLTDWSSDEDEPAAASKNKYSKLVVLEGMFTLQELEEDATLLLDLKEDVRDECETMGEVTNVTLYDVSSFAALGNLLLLTSLIPNRKKKRASSRFGSRRMLPLKLASR